MLVFQPPSVASVAKVSPVSYQPSSSRIVQAHLRSLAAPAASALARLTRALAVSTTAVALRLLLSINLNLLHIGLLRRRHRPSSLVRVRDITLRFASLERREMLRLVVHIQHLLAPLLVERTQPLPRRRIGSLLVIARQPAPRLLRTAGRADLLVHLRRTLRDLVVGVELVEGAHETVAEPMLLVESEGTLDCFIADDVAVGEILGDDARAGLVFLCDVLLVVRLFGGGRLAAGDLVERGGGGDGDLGGAELGVVEEEGGLGCGFLLEGYRGGLGGVGVVGLWGHGEGLDFAAGRG